MANPYERKFNFSGLTSAPPLRARKRDAIADMWDLGETVAPAGGALIGGALGSIVPGVGTAIGAGLGGTAGAALGNIFKGQAANQRNDDDERVRRQQLEDDERAAQHQAALQMLNGLH